MTAKGPSTPRTGQTPTANGKQGATLQGRGTLAAVISSIVFPLALTQFIASYAGSNMNVAITSIAEDLGTTTHGVQTAITLFTLTMAALMIPGSKLTDIWGRKRCFMLGLAIYGLGALLASVAQGLTVLIIGYSFMEGVGSALMIPPIYILLTIVFSDLESRAKAFGIVSAAAGLGSAARVTNIGGRPPSRRSFVRARPIWFRSEVASSPPRRRIVSVSVETFGEMGAPFPRITVETRSPSNRSN